MGFTEESQTFLVAAYYRELKETFGERGIEAFVHAVKQYGMQRGNRMAQRADRNWIILPSAGMVNGSRLKRLSLPEKSAKRRLQDIPRIMSCMC